MNYITGKLIGAILLSMGSAGIFVFLLPSAQAEISDNCATPLYFRKTNLPVSASIQYPHTICMGQIQKVSFELARIQDGDFQGEFPLKLLSQIPAGPNAFYLRMQATLAQGSVSSGVCDRSVRDFLYIRFTLDQAGNVVGTPEIVGENLSTFDNCHSAWITTPVQYHRP